MSPLKPPPPPDGSAAKAPKKAEAGSPGGVLVQKRAPKPPGLREKLCATCGKPFLLTPDQKFYDCPDCYRKTHPLHKPRRHKDAQILVQIQCMACGTREYLDFAPPDPKEALCRACFARSKRERKAAAPHSQEGEDS